jgi:hypothetical protein
MCDEGVTGRGRNGEPSVCFLDDRNVARKEAQWRELDD